MDHQVLIQRENEGIRRVIECEGKAIIKKKNNNNKSERENKIDISVNVSRNNYYIQQDFSKPFGHLLYPEHFPAVAGMFPIARDPICQAVFQ